MTDEKIKPEACDVEAAIRDYCNTHGITPRELQERADTDDELAAHLYRLSLACALIRLYERTNRRKAH
jgi:hypothetical protein